MYEQISGRYKRLVYTKTVLYVLFIDTKDYDLNGVAFIRHSARCINIKNGILEESHILYLHFVLLQGGVIAIWGVVYYGFVIGNRGNAVATLIPAVLILLYNQKRGTNSVLAKCLFYVFYPIHLLLIGLVNMFLKA